MTTDNKTNPATQPSTFPPSPRQMPGVPGQGGDKNSEDVDKFADHIAHKGAETVQNFDKENGKLFSR